MKCSRTIVALRPPCAFIMKGFMESYARDAAARKRSRDSGENRQNVEIKKIYRQRIDDDCVSASPNPSSSSSTSIQNVYNGPPHFLVIGAQKAGTMAVVKNLNKHPEIACLSEEHYFDLGWHSRSISSYRSLLCKSQASGTEKIILGEKTPEYGYVEECHNRIKSVCKQGTKFIMMIRDPVKRAYSAWNMNVKRNFEVNLFDECVDKNFKNLSEYRSYGTAEYHYVQRGFYLDQILRFLETFPDR